MNLNCVILIKHFQERRSIDGSCVCYTNIIFPRIEKEGKKKRKEGSLLSLLEKWQFSHAQRVLSYYRLVFMRSVASVNQLYFFLFFPYKRNNYLLIHWLWVNIIKTVFVLLAPSPQQKVYNYINQAKQLSLPFSPHLLPFFSGGKLLRDENP